MTLSQLQDNLNYLERRFIFVILLVSTVFLIIIVQLAFLQIKMGQAYRTFADENTLKEIRLPAPRGAIRDRDGRSLASSRPAFNLAVVPQYVKSYEHLRTALAELSGIAPEQIDQVWQQRTALPPFFPLIVADDIPYEVMAKIRAYAALEYQPGDPYDLRGIEILPRPLRRYPEGNVAPLVLGYVREISPRELKRLKNAVPGWYFLGDRIGSTHLERKWELLLKGGDGFGQRVVNAVGREVGHEAIDLRLVAEPARPGNDLVTTLVAPLQAYAEERFGEHTGAVVALAPQTGEILALVSHPQFDLPALAGRVPETLWTELVQNPGKVFLNRAVNAAYPPGSTYKIVVAAAALEEGVTTPEERIYCPGAFRFGSRAFRCWKSGGHGSVDWHRAIVQSCDVYFYTMGVRLGVDRLAHYAGRFGLGRRPGIELNPETPGLIPTAEWKERVRGQVWYPGETPSISIGQGYDLVSPLQNALVVAAVANGGYWVRPTLTRFFLDSHKQMFPAPGTPLLARKRSLGFSAETIRRLQKALAGVVAEPGGTAGRLRALPFASAGKTGTAQVVGYESRLSGRYRDHAWYVAYAPVEHPEIAVSVLVEHGGHGSSGAAPIAGDIMKKFMELKTKSGEPQ